MVLEKYLLTILLFSSLICVAQQEVYKGPLLLTNEHILGAQLTHYKSQIYKYEAGGKVLDIIQLVLAGFAARGMWDSFSWKSLMYGAVFYGIHTFGFKIRVHLRDIEILLKKQLEKVETVLNANKEIDELIF